MLSYLLNPIESNFRESAPTHLCKQGWAKLLRPTGTHGKGKVIYVSLEDHEHFGSFSWSINCKTGYANGMYGGKIWSGDKPKYLHRLVLINSGVLKDSDAKLTDHIDGNRLNNARWNLRAASFLENAHNIQKSGSLPYLGIAVVENGYAAQIRVDGKHLVVRPLKTVEAAAKTYDALARFYRGEYAKTNFPGDEAYDINEARKRFGRKNPNGFFGVTKLAETRYAARVRIDKKGVHLGTYRNAKDAGLAVDKKLIERDCMPLNFSEAECREAPTPKRIFQNPAASGYKGVLKQGNRYRAFIYQKSKDVGLGSFLTAEDAARAVDDARAKHGLPRVNFPSS